MALSINKLQIDSRKQVDHILESNHIEINTRRLLLKNLYWFNDNELRFRINISVINNYIQELMAFDVEDSYWEGSAYFIKGEKSDYIMPSDSQIIKKYFPNSQILNIKEAQHWVHFDQKKSFIDTINKILK